jgi:hypothetical protein
MNIYFFNGENFRAFLRFRVDSVNTRRKFEQWFYFSKLNFQYVNQSGIREESRLNLAISGL